MNGETHSLPPSTPVTDVTGETPNEPSPSHNEPPNRPARRGRSGTRMRDVSLSRSVGSKLEIQFDEMLEPCGPNKHKYTSFVGHLARSKVSILIDEWKNVDRETVKEPLWDNIRLSYNVPDSERLKEKTFSYCAERWRKFKTFLTNTYIFPREPREYNPWDKYTFIDQQTWEQFVQQRTTDEAMRIRAQAQEIGRRNNCPHVYSRGGYQKAEKELMAAKRKRLEDEAQSNPSAIIGPPSPIRREELWLHIRQKQPGVYTSEQTRIVAEKIEDLKKKEAEGSFVSDGKNDVLTIATEKLDHAGRVRGIGGRVGIKQYFGKTKRHRQSMITREEMDQTVAKISGEFEAQLRQMKEEMLEMKMLLTSRPQSTEPFTHTPAPMMQPSTRGSCIGQTPPQHCDLYVAEPHRQLVARGTVHQGRSTVHHRQLSDGEVAVSVEKVITDAPLPLPTDEWKLVSDVIGSFIPWPVHLVHVGTEASPPPEGPPPPQTTPPPEGPSPGQTTPPPQSDLSPTASLTPKEKISALVSEGYFKDKDWEFDEAVGLPHPSPVYFDTADVLSLLTPGQELNSPIVQMFIK